MENLRRENALVLGCTSSVDLDGYMNAVPDEFQGAASLILLPQGHGAHSSNSKWNIINFASSWSSFDETYVNQAAKDKFQYDHAVILCTYDPVVSYNRLAACVVHLQIATIIIIYKDLTNEVVQFQEKDNTELNYHRIMRRLTRDLKPANTEIHTNFVAIHPYFGYVCRPNSVIDFGVKVPKIYAHETLIETDQCGFRNDFIPKCKPTNEYWIGLFGGSSAFSIAASDNQHTIAAFLESKLRALFPSKNIRVFSFALPAGKQPQQLNIFMHFHSRLDGIVCFDGANEVLLPTYFQGKIPGHFPFFQFYPTLFGRPSENKQFAFAWMRNYLRELYENRSKLVQFLVKGIFKRCDDGLTKSLNMAALQAKGRFESLYDDGETLKTSEQLAHDSAKLWSEHILIMRDIAQPRNIETLFILQPTADIGKNLTETERKVVNDGFRPANNEVLFCFGRLQEQQKSLSENGVNCLDFTNIFEGNSEDIYTDYIHFEDRGCQIVAARIAEEISSSWKSVSK